MSTKIKFNNDLTQEYIKELMYFDKDSGVFISKVKRGNKIAKNDFLGIINKDGYVGITINRKFYSAHRLAWMYVYGKFPNEFIDHINGNRTDNRICNLREASSKENNRNRGMRGDNRTGYIGVHKSRYNTYYARIKIDGKTIHLGSYKSPEEASQIRENYVKKLYGNFYRK